MSPNSLLTLISLDREVATSLSVYNCYLRSDPRPSSGIGTSPQFDQWDIDGRGSYRILHGLRLFRNPPPRKQLPNSAFRELT